MYTHSSTAGQFPGLFQSIPLRFSVAYLESVADAASQGTKRAGLERDVAELTATVKDLELEREAQAAEKALRVRHEEELAQARRRSEQLLETIREKDAALQQLTVEAKQAATKAKDFLAGGGGGGHGEWQQLWHPNAEAAIAAAKAGEEAALRQLADLTVMQLEPVEAGSNPQGQEGINGSGIGGPEVAESVAAVVPSWDPSALAEAASVAGAAFITLSEAASSGDPNDPRNAVEGAGAGVDEATETLRSLFKQWGKCTGDLRTICSPGPSLRECVWAQRRFYGLTSLT